MIPLTIFFLVCCRVDAVMLCVSKLYDCMVFMQQNEMCCQSFVGDRQKKLSKSHPGITQSLIE